MSVYVRVASLLGSFSISKVLMIRRDIRFEMRVGLHLHKLLNITEHYLNDTVIIGDVGELGIVDSIHQGSCGARVVSLYACGIPVGQKCHRKIGGAE